MSRASAFVAGLALGIVLATGIMVSRADPAEAEVEAAAAQAGVPVVALEGAMSSTHMGAFEYLWAVGELPKPYDPPPKALTPQPPPAPSSSRLADCIIQAESRGNPGAVNARSGASGLGQFLPSTWRTTPQGKAGLSVFDPAANRAAVNYMIAAGRAGEFSTLGLCR